MAPPAPPAGGSTAGSGPGSAKRTASQAAGAGGEGAPQRGPPPIPPMFGPGGPASAADCQAAVERLTNPKIDLREKTALAIELRDTADTQRDATFYATYLNTLVPKVIQLLLEGQPGPSFIKDSPENRLRGTLLTFLQRLPHNETLKPHTQKLMEAALELLKRENEENALHCIKIVIDGFRSHKEQTEPHVKPFLELVKQMYANTRSVVEKEFGAPAGDPGSAAPSNVLQPQNQAPAATATRGGAQASPAKGKPPGPGQEPARLPQALFSPKVLTECPIAVVLIFQSFKKLMHTAMQDFYPLVMDSITIQPEPQRQAYLAAEARGEIFTGVAEGIKNREMYTEVIKAQVKTMAFLAYVLRGSADNIKMYLDVFPVACVRLLRDCPPEDVATRKELLIATRHILSSEFRAAFIPHVDILLDERVLVGSGVTSREALRPLAYSTLADLIHHVRSDLSQEQLTKVIAVYSHITHDPTYSLAIQNMCAKLLLSSIDSLCTKGNRAEAIKLMTGMLDASVRKVGSLYRSFDRAKRAALLEKERSKPKADIEDEDVDMDAPEKPDVKSSGPNELEWREVERAMPVAAPNSALESFEGFLKEARSILKTLLHTFRSLLNNLRMVDAPPVLGDVLGALFRNSILALRIHEGARDPREEKDALELLGLILTHFQPHVFAEVWTSNMPFFVDQVLENPHSITLLQSMLVHAEVSHQTVAILLKYLMANLEGIGSQDKTRASLTLKLFKLSFMAVNSFIERNEPVLVPHLAKLIIDSFSHAAKAADPVPYYQILRALFRSIGGGRFEALYKEVLPILEEMLETLNYLLAHSEPAKKDLFVELCLTVPVRLTNLLPHLGYLMKPLVHALNAGSDLVSQGLRTLELCIDNLTSEFLDPTMGPVFRDLMSALYNLLQPLPYNHQHSHSAVKILGKLGGRNRRFQQRPYLLDYRPIEENVSISLTFENRRERLIVAGWIDTAAKAVTHTRSHYRLEAVKLLKQTAKLFVQNRVLTVGQEPIFSRNVKALFAALPYEDTREDIKDYLRAYSQAVLQIELENQTPRDGVLNRRPCLLTVAYVSAMTSSMADCNEEDRAPLENVSELVLDDFLAARQKAFENEPSQETRMNAAVILQCFFSKFIGLCFEEDWRRKLAGCAGLRIMTNREQLEAKWTVDRQLEFVRAIFFALRDAPKEAPRSLASVVELLRDIIKKCNTNEAGAARLPKLIDMLVLELPSHKAIVRETAQECIELLAGMKDVSIHDLIVKAAKERLLDTGSSPIFNKPLRALPFGMQIGNMDAITYLLTLRPSLPEINDELVRLVHETIALADADDASLIGRVVHHAAELSLRSLRVACLKLLCAAMSFPDIFGKQPTSKTKIIAVYFKHMYSPSPQIVQIAHDGLKTVLAHQAKLPKEILQTGLRPILVNLADAKRLSVSGLEGLSRFLELLTNYFKVEIGQKLLDHFRTLADPAMLTQAAERPYEDSGDIARMVRLVNVFRLLPPTANVFLKDLTLLVVETETELHQSRPGPFTNNLALYFERYSSDAVAFLLDNLNDARVVRSFRYVITCGQAPTVVEELSSKADKICDMCFRDTQEVDSVLHGIQLISELSKTSDSWMIDHMEVLKALVTVWRSLVSGFRQTSQDQPFPRVFTQEPALLLEIFMEYLSKNSHVELFFHVVEALEIPNVFECADVPYFFYQQVAQVGNVSYKREILDHFFTIFGDNTVSQTFKTNAFRNVVNPLLFVHFTRPSEPDTKALMTPELVSRTKDEIWTVCLERYRKAEMTDELMVELLHMATIFAQHHIAALEGSRKFVAKVAWECMSAKDATLRHVAYLLSARFLNVDPAVAANADKSGSAEKSRLQMENEKHRLNLVRTTWTGLLKSKETEARAIYRRAVDVMASCLPLQDPAAEGGIPHWAYVAKMILVEEGHTTPQLVAICELIVTHGDLFFACRDLFVGLMANSLTKLGFVPGATPEMKKLTIDIVELIFRWERRRMTASPAIRSADSERNADASEGGVAKKQRIDTAGTAISSSSAGGWQLPVQVRELITSYLVRLVSTSQEALHRHGLTERALKLLREILSPQGLPGVTAKLSFFQRTMGGEVTDQNLTIVSNSAEVVAIVALNKDKTWLNVHLGTLLKLLEHPVLSDHAQLHDTLRPILVRMFGCLPAPHEQRDITPDQSALAQWADTIVNNINSNQPARLHGSIFVIQCYVEARPEKMAEVVSGITKLMNRLTKDLTTMQVPMAQADTAHRAIINILQLCRSRIDAFDSTEIRRNFVSAMAHLIENCPSLPMSRYILDVVRDWILKVPNASFPTLKEKAGLLNKMMAFEHRGDDDLLKDYLELILDIFNEPTLQKSELTSRTEHPFLLGTRCREPVLRFRFVAMLDDCLPKDSYGRLQYILSTQSWDYLNTSYWITLATDLLLGSMEAQDASQPKPADASGLAANDVWRSIRAPEVIAPLRQLLPLDDDATHDVWTSAFSTAWLGLPRAQQLEASRWLTILLAKEHHSSQVSRRPNVVQSLLSGVLACGRSLQLPPFVVKYLGKTYNAWHIAMEILANSLDHFGADDQLRDTCADALTELYAELSEDDLFYGLWRRRALHDETNAALALEQNGLWPRAQELYELAQSKARAGSIPYTENEYSLWQDHWILAAQKLQQWDILTDLARHEGNHDLLLECAWRLSDWGSADREMIEKTLKAVENVATPRRKVFEAYTALIKAHTGQEKPADFMRVLDEAIQLAIRRWVSFPKQLSSAHIPLLQLFQQYVELQEAASVFESLTLTNQQNLEARVTQDLKPIFQTWRERLPNFWDDISVWSDLLAWRQHVFSAVTKVYVPLIPQHETATYGYRGYHETAWTINRFGHVARKHQLSDVCTSALGKIYALPNIEISEAFLKLREQAMCYYQKPDKFAEGLESISTTNLMYFAPAQKAEFLTLKGMFIAKLGQTEDANLAFAQAVQMDLNLPKAWAEWGRYNDRLFRDRPAMPGPQPEPGPGEMRLPDQQWAHKHAQEKIALAANAVSCYLQAAGLYKSAKARKLLIRVLWLLSLDDASGAISKAFEAYQGDMAIWYWITLIPQLLLSLSHREARHARSILMKIAKVFPQALFYHLRTTKEDFTQLQRQHAMQLNARKMMEAKRQQAARAAAAAANGDQGTATEKPAVISGASADLPATDSPAKADQDVKMEEPDAATSSRAPPAIQIDPAPAVEQSAQPNGASSRAPASAQAPAAGDAAAASPSSAPTQAASANPSGPQTAATTPAAEQAQSANVGQQPQSARSAPSGQPQIPTGQAPRMPQELLDEILSILKTAFPLLALSMEKMVDHINVRAQPPKEEDVYRFFFALLSDAMGQWGSKLRIPTDEELVPQDTLDKIRYYISSHAPEIKGPIHQKFLQAPLKLREYIHRMQQWHDQFERSLDARAPREALDHGQCLLSDFHHSKFDDVEVPGQYIEHVDSNADFAKIGRFAPTLELARGYGFCFRRITMIGNNGANHTFAVQSPSGRHCRREERLTQLFRIMNTVLQKRKESRKRNLSIHLPAAIPLTPALRLVAVDNSYLTLQDVFDEHCRERKLLRDKPMLSFVDKFRQVYQPSGPTVDHFRRDFETVEYKVARMEVVEEIAAKYVPEDVLTKFMTRTMSSPSSLWLMRKQFALQTASAMFISHVACCSNRAPSRFHFSLRTGMMYMSEVLPSFDSHEPLHRCTEHVPFRLTPNMQHFITPTGVEGLLTSAVMAMARSLTNPEFDLPSCLSLFLRDEVLVWFHLHGKGPQDVPNHIMRNAAEWNARTEEIAFTGDANDRNDMSPIVAPIITLIAKATNTQNLAMTSENFIPYF